MKRTMKRIFTASFACCALFALALLAGCGQAQLAASNDYGEATASDKSITVDLQANETTGYSWSYSTDSKVWTVEAEEYIPDENSSGQAGVGGTQHYVFTCKGEDPDAVINFYYARPWETSDTQPQPNCRIVAASDANCKVTTLTFESLQ